MSTLKVGEIKHENFTGTTQLKLDNSGQLGIGKTPGVLLDVNADAKINSISIGKGANSVAGNTVLVEVILPLDLNL